MVTKPKRTPKPKFHSVKSTGPTSDPTNRFKVLTYEPEEVINDQGKPASFQVGNNSANLGNNVKKDRNKRMRQEVGLKNMASLSKPNTSGKENVRKPQAQKQDKGSAVAHSNSDPPKREDLVRKLKAKQNEGAQTLNHPPMPPASSTDLRSVNPPSLEHIQNDMVVEKIHEISNHAAAHGSPPPEEPDDGRLMDEDEVLEFSSEVQILEESTIEKVMKSSNMQVDSHLD